MDTQNKTVTVNYSGETRFSALLRIGGIAAIVQLLSTLTTIIVVLTLGDEPKTASEYYKVLADDRFTGILRMDFASLINVTLYSVISFAIYAALKNKKFYGSLAVAFVFLGVALSVSSHSGFSMINLADKYAAASTESLKLQLLTAGEAVIAADWWNSTGGFMAGIFMQGGAVILSFIMLHNHGFSKITAYCGILANGLDFLHIFAGLIYPAAGILFISIGGIFYLAWFPFLSRDLFRLAKNQQ